MTKALAPTYAASLLTSAAPDLSSVNIKVAGMSASYTYSSAHDFYNDVTNVVQLSGNLGSKTTTAGVFDAADLTLGSPAFGSTITQFWLFHDTGTAATSPLIYYWNEDASGSAISIATDGTAITVQWNASGIYAVT